MSKIYNNVLPDEEKARQGQKRPGRQKGKDGGKRGDGKDGDSTDALDSNDNS